MSRWPASRSTSSPTAAPATRATARTSACSPTARRSFPFIAEQLTEARVAEAFRHRRPSAVKRYLLPKLHGMNFVLDGVLDGGVNDSLNLDTHGKSLVFLVLEIEIEVPAELVPG